VGLFTNNHQAQYQVFELDPAFTLVHKDSVDPMMSSDNLHNCLDYAYKTHILLRIETCVWDTKNHVYRDYYRNEEESA